MTADPTQDGPHGIYVGYLPLPRRYRLFVMVAVPLLVIVAGALAGAMASVQRDPGVTEHVAAGEARWSGTVFIEPHPLLAGDDGHSYLLASTMKAGVADRTTLFDGKRCVLTGTVQARGGRRVLLVADGEDAIRELAEGSASLPPTMSEPRSIRIVGEILDSKCYTGAMKPGDGKGHKACAILCLRGGIAAIVAAPALAGDESLPLLRVDGSTLLPDQVLELVGEPVVITGVLSQAGGIPVLDSSPDQIKRWKPGTSGIP